MTTFVISLIRSNVAPLVGALATWLISLGLTVPEEAKQGLITFLFFFLSGIYYLVVRLLEEKYPQVGILLGYAKTPDSYSKGPGVELTQKPNGDPQITVTVGTEATSAAHVAEQVVVEPEAPRHSL